MQVFNSSHHHIPRNRSFVFTLYSKEIKPDQGECDDETNVDYYPQPNRRSEGNQHDPQDLQINGKHTQLAQFMFSGSGTSNNRNKLLTNWAIFRMPGGLLKYSKSIRLSEGMVPFG